MGGPMILTLMKVPVQLINLTVCLLGGMVYAPSYAYFFLTQKLIFSQALNTSLFFYALSWLSRVAALAVGIVLFPLQFVYPMLWYWEKQKDLGIWIKMAGLVISTLGFLFLMRRGYLKALKYLKIPSLKSPSEHLWELGLLLSDTPGILLGFINTVMISHSLETLNYLYDPTKKNFLPHICHLVGASILFNFQKPVCLYLRVFSWRLKDSDDFGKEQPYTLERSVLLAFILTNTNIDIACFILFGWESFLSPWRLYRRYLKTLKESSSFEYRMVTMSHFLFTIFEYLQLVVLALCLPFNPRRTIDLFRKVSDVKGVLLRNHKDDRQLERQLSQMCQSVFLLGLTLCQLVAFLAGVPVFLSVYKQRKLNNLKLEPSLQQSKPATTSLTSQQFNKYKSQLNRELKKVMYCLEFLVDIPFWMIVAVVVVMAPGSYRLVFKMINCNHDVERKRVLQYLATVVGFYLIAGYLAVTLPLYLHRIAEHLHSFRNPSPEEKVMSTMKRLRDLAFRIIKQSTQDLRYLPLYYSVMVFGPPAGKGRLSIENCQHQYSEFSIESQIIFHQSIVRLKNKSLIDLYDHDKQLITSLTIKREFWRTAHRVVDLRSAIKILRLPILLTRYLNSSYSKLIPEIQERYSQKQISSIARELLTQQEILKLTLEMNLRIGVEFVLALVGMLLVLLSLWRAPTLIHLFRTKKYQVLASEEEPKSMTIFKGIVFVFLQEILDLLMLPLFVLATILCPLRVIKYICTFSYRYEAFENKQQLYSFFAMKRKYFIQKNLAVSISDWFYCVEIALVMMTLTRIPQLKAILKKQGLSLKEFFLHVSGWGQLPPLHNPQTDHEQGIALTKQLIHHCTVEALRDMVFMPIFLMMLCFPYRYNYIKAAVGMEEVPASRNCSRAFYSGRRREITRLLIKILRNDILCAVLNASLILSVLRTKQGLQLLAKNWRRNFCIRVLNYDYKRELMSENLLLLKDIAAIIELAIIFLNVVRVKDILSKLRDLRKTRKQQKKAEKEIEEIKETTKRSGKEDKIGLIGFYNFKSICYYLQPQDVCNLEKASQDMYLWCNKEELWEDLWNQRYKTDNPPSEQVKFRDMCITEYTLHRPQQSPPATIHSLIRDQLKESLRASFNLLEFLNLKFQIRAWEADGTDYGEILPYPYEMQVLMQYCVVVPVSRLTLWVSLLFVGPRHRYFKQAIVAFGIPCVILFQLGTTGGMWYYLYFGLDKYIAFKVMGAFLVIYYFLLFNLNLHARLRILESIVPFDMPQHVEAYLAAKKDRLMDCFRKTKDMVVVEVEKVATKAWNASKSAGKKTYHKIVLPLYKKVATLIRSVRDFVLTLWKSLKQGVLLLYHAVINILILVRQGLTHFRRGYFGILMTTMNFMLKMGRVGDLVFTLLALVYLSLPLVISYFLYWKVTAIVPSLILTLISMVKGYKAIHTNHNKID